MLKATDIRVCRGDRVVGDGVNLSASAGKVLGIVGPNGSGKSSMLFSLFRALELAGGRVEVDGDDIAKMKRRQIAEKISVVAQEREDTLALSVYDYVMLGRLAGSSLPSYGNNADQEIVARALSRVSITELSQRMVTQLSGGERQRVAIARAIAQKSDYLLLDEPTNHLDLHYQFELLDLVKSLDCTTIIVLHDLNLAAQCCDEILMLCDGKIVASGPPCQVLTKEIITPVYSIDVDVITHYGLPHLIFSRREGQN